MAGAQTPSMQSLPSMNPLQHRTLVERDALIEEHLPMVPPIAREIFRRVPHAFELDDLMQVGRMALVEAADKWRSDGGVPFRMYARYTIRFAILDSVRRRHYDEATTRSFFADIPEPVYTPNEIWLSGEPTRLLKAAIARLSPLRQKIIDWIYFEDRPLGHLAAQMNICRTLVGFHHKQALYKIRNAFRSYLSPEQLAKPIRLRVREDNDAE